MSKTEKERNERTDPIVRSETGCLVARSIYLAGGYNRGKRTRGEKPWKIVDETYAITKIA